MHLKKKQLSSLVLALTISCLQSAIAKDTNKHPDAEFPSETLWNEIQVIGSHNSYKKAIDPPLLKLLLSVSSKLQSLDYHHVSLSEQLDLGLRSLELDLYNDPEGGRFADPLGLRMVRQMNKTPAPYDLEAFNQPGFKVMHNADIDFRSWQPTFVGALAELKAWSDANAGHLPIVITMNLKDDKTQMPGSVEPIPFDKKSLDRIDETLIAGLGKEKLIVPDEIRGEAETLESAILTKGWPPLRELEGRFLFAIDEGGEKRLAYLKGYPSLAGRAMFTTPQPGSPDSALLVINDPIKEEARIRRLVAKGYLVRTRADAVTREARSGDTRRFEAAVRSNAHIITTDYYLPDQRFNTGYCVKFDKGIYARKMTKAE